MNACCSSLVLLEEVHHQSHHFYAKLIDTDLTLCLSIAASLRRCLVNGATSITSSTSSDIYHGHDDNNNINILLILSCHRRHCNRAAI